MSNVYELRTKRLPNDTKKVLELLREHAEDPHAPLEGFAFIAIVDDTGFIADAVGKARADPGEARKMLRALDAKLKALEKKQSHG